MGIEVRKAKLQALGKQREALTRSINGEGQTLANLFPLIRKHADALDIACKKMPTNTERMLAKLKTTKADASSSSTSKAEDKAPASSSSDTKKEEGSSKT